MSPRCENRLARPLMRSGTPTACASDLTDDTAIARLVRRQRPGRWLADRGREWSTAAAQVAVDAPAIIPSRATAAATVGLATTPR